LLQFSNKKAEKQIFTFSKSKMLQVGYFNDNRLHIDEYDETIHAGKVLCSDGHILVAKRGNVREHHFSHKSKEGENCKGSDGKTSWHLWWQTRLLPKALEFRFQKIEKSKFNDAVEVSVKTTKIADSINVINGDTLSIIEFQNSKMEVDEFRLRESFYTRTDLMEEWGVPYCKSSLTWIFNLTQCDVEIDYVFGDVICFKWVKGTKYMFNAKMPAYWDFGKRELVYILEIHKPKVIESKIVGIIISMEDFDEHYFKGALKENLDQDQLRTNRLSLTEYQKISPEIRNQILELAKDFYFERSKKDRKHIKSQIKALLKWNSREK